VLAFMGAFSAKSQALLRATVGQDRLIEVSEHDAEMFACNAIDLGDTIVMHDASHELRERLSSIGYRVRTTDLSDFHRSGGSAKCLTLKLEDGPAKAAPMRLRATG
jgi:N-dimethylarginine dimethylaminohydrolase